MNTGSFTESSRRPTMATCFSAKSTRHPFPLEEEWFERLKPVTEKLRGIFGPAVAYMRLLVGPRPDDADPTEFVPTGLKIPPPN